MLSMHSAFRGRPTLGQFAKQGAWESAWAFAIGELPSREQLQDYLGGTTEVAFEAFFGDAFFGLRLQGDAAEVEARAQACIAATADAAAGDGFIAALCRHLGCQGFGREVAFAEVGAVNAWRSVGAFRIDDPSPAMPWLHALLRAPVALNTTHRKAIEFAAPHPLPHWFALPVSASAPPFAIEPALLRGALEAAAAPRLRTAGAADAEAIAALHAESWRTAYRGALSDEYLSGDVMADRRALWQQRLDAPRPNQQVIVAETNDGLAGFACVFAAEHAQWGSLLENIHVSQALQGQGLGRRLLCGAAAWCAEAAPRQGLHLSVLQGNLGAQRFYAGLGAANVGEEMWNAPDGRVIPTYRFAWASLAPLLAAHR
jgi:GNAT superfamily N-acetyltransferase